MSIVSDFVKEGASRFVDKSLKSFLGIGGDGNGEREGFSAENMVASLAKSGVAHSGHFEVQLQSNKNEFGSLFERDMMYRAESVELPGRSLATVDHRFDNYSPIARVVTGQTYTDVSVTFLLSEDLREKQYFEGWQNSAVGTGAFAELNANETRNNPKFYHDYVGTVTIRQYGADGTLRSVHHLDNAFPIVLGGVQMNWGDDSHARLSVSFSYNRYRVVFYNQDQAKKGISGGFSLGPNGFAGKLSIPGFGSIGTGGGRTAVDLGGVKKKIFSAVGL
jgi:hypothetical protein